MNDQWGVGNQADSEAFDTTLLYGSEVELIHGEHPHSRQDNTTYARTKEGVIHDFNGHRRLIDIEIKSSNYLKESEFSGDEIRKQVIGKVFVDGVQLIEEFGRDPLRMMRHLERLIEEYQEHSSNWFSKKAREEMIGKKIYYHDQPATITRVIESQGAIIITTDPDFKPPVRGDDGFDSWDDWREGDHYEVKDEVLSPHIWWWRS